MNKLRILVVDDDRDFAEGMADVLQLHGHRVEQAFTGEEAIERSRDEDFDVIFLDVKLPGKNGVECFLEIHRVKPDARVVIMTGYSVEQLLDLATANGAWLTLHKPLDMSRVLEMIKVIEPCGGALLLIADDDPDFAESLREFLEARRYRVLVAHDGQQALDYLRARDDVDVLVLDLRMPVKTGLEVFQELKKEGRALPTIVVTGYPIEEAESLGAMRCLEVAGVLVKPFNPDDLVQALEGVVGSGKEPPP
jgi:CheY-like chemotaxis protein